MKTRRVYQFSCISELNLLSLNMCIFCVFFVFVCKRKNWRIWEKRNNLFIFVQNSLFLNGFYCKRIEWERFRRIKFIVVGSLWYLHAHLYIIFQSFLLLVLAYSRERKEKIYFIGNEWNFRYESKWKTLVCLCACECRMQKFNLSLMKTREMFERKINDPKNVENVGKCTYVKF